MRINWFHQGLFILAFIYLFYLAADTDYYFHARNVISLGEPDPLLLLIMGLSATWLSTYSFFQWQRNIAPIYVSKHKRLAIHNIDEFGHIDVPETFIKAMKDLGIEYPRRFSVYIGEGIRSLRMTGSGETVVAIAPTDYVQKHSNFVDDLSDSRPYIGLEQYKPDALPKWALDWCITYVPGFVPMATEVIFGDKPHEQAVRAWDVGKNREVWTRGITDMDLDHQGRINYLMSNIKIEDNANKRIVRQIEDAKKNRERKPAEPPKPTPVPAQEHDDGQGGK